MVHILAHVRLVGMRTSLLLSVLLGLSTACGGSTGEHTEEAEGAQSRGQTTATSSELLGTWDVVFATDSGPDEAVLKLEEKRVSFDSHDTHIVWNVDGNVVLGAERSMENTLDVTHEATTADFGLVPYKLGGSWTFKDFDRGSCDATLDETSGSVTCANLGHPIDQVFSQSEATTLQRKKKLTSRFGALGGTWRLAGPHYAIDVTFEGSTFRVTGTSGEPVMELTFAKGDARASGRVDGSGEISAQKR